MASAIGAAVSLLQPVKYAWRLMVSFATLVCRTSLCPRLRNTRSRTCQERRSCIFLAVAIAKPTGCPMSLGSSLRRRRLDGRAFRRFAILSMTTFNLAITFCRCMNIPARYCTGYLGDMGMPPPYGPGDFAGWFEAYIGGRWYTFDPRNNVPRIGRILIAQGRDAADVPITQTFGPNTL